MIDEREQELKRKVAAHLDETVADIDPETLRRLRQGRVAAVEKASRRSFAPQWLTAGGIATAAVILVSLTFLGRPTVPEPRQPEDLEIITAQEHLDLYEDLEFYKWLAADDHR